MIFRTSSDAGMYPEFLECIVYTCMIYHDLFHVLLFFAYSFVYVVVCFLLFVQATKSTLGENMYSRLCLVEWHWGGTLRFP